MAKNGRVVDPEAPYGWNKDGTPSKKRGRAPGVGTRVPGSGRKKNTMTSKSTSEYLLPLWARAMDDILSCRPFRVAGPMGKTITRIRNSDEFKHALSVVGHKCLPDQKQVTSDVRSEVTHREPAEPRELARAVLGIFNSAKLAEEAANPVEETFEDARPADGQLLLGRDRIIDVPYSVSDQPPSTAAALSNGGDVGVAGSASPPSSSNANTSPPTTSQGDVSADEGASQRLAAAPSSSSDKKPEHGDRITIDTNGAHLWYSSTRKLWAKIDNLNHPHGWNANKDEALQNASTFPRYSGTFQQHPFEPVLQPNSGDEPRRDNVAYPVRAELKVIRKRPR